MTCDIPTAHALERGIHCHGSVVLPKAYEESGEWCERGTVIANVIRAVTTGTDIQVASDDVDDDEWRDTCQRMNVRKLFDGMSDVMGEAAYRYSIKDDSAFLIGYNIGRNYPPRPPWYLDGTNDIEGTRYDGVPVVIDVKTGQRVTDAEHNPQLKFHALVKMRVTGAPEVEGRIAYLRPDGEVYLDTHTFTSFDMDLFASELEDAYKAWLAADALIAEGRMPAVNEGHWCRYCPAKRACPIFTGLVKAMTVDVPALGAEYGIDEESVKRRLAVMQPQQLAATYEKAKRYEAILEVLLKGIKEIAKDEKLPLGDGRYVGSFQSSRKSFDQTEALKLLRESGATDKQLQGLYKTSHFPVVKIMGRATRKTRVA